MAAGSSTLAAGSNVRSAKQEQWAFGPAWLGTTAVRTAHTGTWAPAGAYVGQVCKAAVMDSKLVGKLNCFTCLHLTLVHCLA